MKKEEQVELAPPSWELPDKSSTVPLLSEIFLNPPSKNPAHQNENGDGKYVWIQDPSAPTVMW